MLLPVELGIDVALNSIGESGAESYGCRITDTSDGLKTHPTSLLPFFEECLFDGGRVHNRSPVEGDAL